MGLEEKTNKYAVACSIIASINSILLGYDTGVMSGALLFIQEDMKISDVQVEVLVGVLNLCALIGSAFSGRTADWIGRRYTIVFASCIFFAGAILMGLAPTYGMLLAGRCVAGVGVGYALMVSPVYSAEIASSAKRGFLTSLPEFCISFGILLGYIANLAFAGVPLKYGWRVMLGIGAVPSIGLACGVFSMPESPRWLVMQGRLGDAKRVLLKVTNTKEECEARLRDIKIAVGIDKNCNEEMVKPSTKSHGEGVWKELLLRPTPTVRRILLRVAGIHFFEHATGITAVVLFSPRIFKRAGIHSRIKLLIATIGVGLTKSVFILVATFLLDKVGRRTLLLTSTAGMVAALIALGTGLTVMEHSEKQMMVVVCLCVGSVLVYSAFFSIGLGPVTWVYSSEIFPLRLRAQGSSIGVAVNRVMNAAVSMSFISLYKAITIGGTFFLFAGIGVVGWLFFFYLFPETKGKSLEEIEELFSCPEEDVRKVELGSKPDASG